MFNCCHCGSPILGKSTTIRLKEFRTMDFHADPSECYIKETILNHNTPDVIRQELLMVGVSD